MLQRTQWVHLSSWISVLFSSDKYPGVEFLSGMVSLVLNFLRNLHTVFHSDCNNLIFHHSHEGSAFSTSCHTHVICCLFDNDNSFPDRCDVICHCGFDLHSLVVSGVEHFSMCLLATCKSSLGKCLLLSSADFN